MATEKHLLNVGNTIDLICEVVDKARNREYDCDICGPTFLPPGHHHCQSCDHAVVQQSLTQCKDCSEWFCKGYCARNHCHYDGQQGRF